MKVVINADDFVQGVSKKLQALANPEYLLRPVCLELVDTMTKRIHVDGKASDDSQIGTYSDGYMKVRTGKFATNEVFKKGKQKGQKKSTGVFTKGKNKGKARPNYNRTDDTKVVISLSRQLENDWTVTPTEKGYGIGFLNEHNFDKSQHVQETYDKRIFDLTEGEQKYALDRFNELTKEALE